MKISEGKREKISEQILSFLYSTYPKPSFTAEIAREIARDEEFTKKLLLTLKFKNLVVDVRKNSKGTKYSKRIRWKLSDKTYLAYSKLHDHN